MIRKLAKNDVGKVLISVILGLGISALFRKVCNDRSCLVFHAPHINKIKGQVFDFDGKCYVFDGRLTKDVNFVNPIKITKCIICKTCIIVIFLALQRRY